MSEMSTEVTEPIINEAAPEISENDAYVESVFNEVDSEDESNDDLSLDSWDEAEEYVAPEEKEEEAEASEEVKAEAAPVEAAAPVEGQEEIAAESKEAPVAELLDVKIAGEIKQFSQEEVISKGKEMLAGEIAYDKKFSELDKERSAWKSEVETVNGYIGEFSSKMKEGDVIGAFQFFGEFANIPPYMIKEQLMHALAPELESRTHMSPDQIQGEYVQKQNEYLKGKLESETRIREQSQSSQERLALENNLREAHSIKEETWNEAASYLKEESVKAGFEVTPDLVKDFIKEEARLLFEGQATDQAESLFSEYNVASDGDSIAAMVKIITDNPSYTEEDLKSIMSDAFGDPKKKQINDDLQRKLNKTEVKSSIQVESQEIEEILDWDDIL